MIKFLDEVNNLVIMNSSLNSQVNTYKSIHEKIMKSKELESSDCDCKNNNSSFESIIKTLKLVENEFDELQKINQTAELNDSQRKQFYQQIENKVKDMRDQFDLQISSNQSKSPYMYVPPRNMQPRSNVPPRNVHTRPNVSPIKVQTHSNVPPVKVHTHSNVTPVKVQTHSNYISHQRNTDTYPTPVKIHSFSNFIPSRIETNQHPIPPKVTTHSNPIPHQVYSTPNSIPHKTYTNSIPSQIANKNLTTNIPYSKSPIKPAPLRKETVAVTYIDIFFYDDFSNLFILYI